MDTNVSRRQVLRFLGGGTLAGAAALAGQHLLSARAEELAFIEGIKWCRLDPVIQLDKRVFHIYVWSYQDSLFSLVTGPTQITISVPVSSKYKVLSVDDGFGQGYDIKFVRDITLTPKGGKTPFKTMTYVPATNGQAVVVDIETPEGAVIGKASGSTNMNLFVSGSI